MLWNFALALPSLHPAPHDQPFPPSGLRLSPYGGPPLTALFNTADPDRTFSLFLSPPIPGVCSFCLPVLSPLEDLLCQFGDSGVFRPRLYHQHLEQGLAFRRASDLLNE